MKIVWTIVALLLLGGLIVLLQPPAGGGRDALSAPEPALQPESKPASKPDATPAPQQKPAEPAREMSAVPPVASRSSTINTRGWSSKPSAWISNRSWPYSRL